MTKNEGEPKTRCSEAGFKHAWLKITSSDIVTWGAPRDWDDYCSNCRLFRKQVEAYEYYLSK
jgi:hypothetical protein